MKSLKKTMMQGFTWSFFEQFGNKILQFLIGITLARMLTPEEFGLIGMTTIFLVFSQTIAAGGFSQALIRKKDCTEDDYNTAFFINLLTGIFIYLVFFAVADNIANFYEKSQLELIVKILFIIVLIDSISFVQRTKIYKKVDFKSLAQINIVSLSMSGLIAIVMAYKGYGVWSLVARSLINRSIIGILLIIKNRWIPMFKFSKTSFTELFSFGYKMLFSNLIDRTYKRIYYLIIGKVYTASLLGYYTRADQFKSLISEQLTSTIQRVTLPILAEIQDEETRLKNTFKKMIINSLFVSSFFMFGLVIVAKPMILFLLGPKWEQSIVFLQIISFSGVLYPSSQLNLNILQVKGRSDLILKLQAIKKIIALPLILISALISIDAMLYALILISIFDFIADSYYSKKLICYSGFMQIKDTAVSIFCMALSAFVASLFLKPLNQIYVGYQFLIVGFSYLLLVIFVFEFTRNSIYLEIKDLIFRQIITLKKKL